MILVDSLGRGCVRWLHRSRGSFGGFWYVGLCVCELGGGGWIWWILVWFFCVCELGRGVQVNVNLVNSGILRCVCVTLVGCGGRAGLGGGGGDFFFGNFEYYGVTKPKYLRIQQIHPHHIPIAQHTIIHQIHRPPPDGKWQGNQGCILVWRAVGL